MCPRCFCLFCSYWKLKIETDPHPQPFLLFLTIKKPWSHWNKQQNQTLHLSAFMNTTNMSNNEHEIHHNNIADNFEKAPKGIYTETKLFHCKQSWNMTYSLLKSLFIYICLCYIFINIYYNLELQAWFKKINYYHYFIKKVKLTMFWFDIIKIHIWFI